MSNKKLIIEERAADIGGFMVGRLLPFRKKRMVGPFIFIDHMGPATIEAGKYMNIGQHPHIGLSTLTYLFEGEILHEDSIGSKQVIRPGAVNWMTAGRGVVHTERTPEQLKDGKKHGVHGYQIWVALPKEKEDMEPQFQHLAKEELPTWEENGVLYTLVAGEGYGKTSPLDVFSHLFMLRLDSLNEAQQVDTGQNLFGEIGICVVEGYVEIEGEKVDAGNMLVAKNEDHCSFTIGENSCVLLFGGEPFAEKRHIYWNFVHSSCEKIEEAKENWQHKGFPMIEGDESYIPLPKQRK